MSADRKFNRTVRVNEDTAHMLGVVRHLIEAQHLPPGARGLTDVGTIRLALEIAALSIGRTEQASQHVLTGTTRTVRDADTGQPRSVHIPSPYMSAALRGSRRHVDARMDGRIDPMTEPGVRGGSGDCRR